MDEIISYVSNQIKEKNILFYFCAISRNFFIIINFPDVTQLSSNQTDNIDWCMVGKGVLLSMGQVYAINDIKTSSLMNLAVFLASPLLFIISSIGALLGTLAGKFHTFKNQI